jgi:hypothetical protein
MLQTADSARHMRGTGKMPNPAQIIPYAAAAVSRHVVRQGLLKGEMILPPSVPVVPGEKAS